MKKTIIIFGVILLFFLAINIHPVYADSSYLTFQQLRLDSGKLLSKFTDQEYNKYLEKVSSRKFIGWNTYYVNKDVRASYISRTVFSYYNSGTTKISYTYNLSDTETAKFSVSASGSISYTGSSGSAKTFKHGLQSALKLEADYSSTSTVVKKENLEVIIDPKSVANLKIVGEGKLSNGVAADYFFWFRIREGGFEYFVVTTEYPRLEVLPI